MNTSKDPKKITTTAKLAAVRRELALRKRVYPTMVKKGSMAFAVAEQEIAVMAAIEEDYRAMVVQEEPAA